MGYETGYGKKHGEKNIPSYQPEYQLQTPEEVMSESMERTARGLRLMQEAHILQKSVETEVA